MTRRWFLKCLLAAGGALLLKGCAERNGKQLGTAGGNRPEAAPGGPWRPAYEKLEEQGGFAGRVEQTCALFERCELCPRRCGVNRLRGEKGYCRAPDTVVVYDFAPHFGEELPLVGQRGSGTIFFSNCNFRCVFCQNWPIAHEGRGVAVTDEQLAEMMLTLQRNGCHNVNLVTPTHVMPNILNAIRLALHKGLKLPLCYNTSGYERVEMVRLLDGIVDIYLPDMKFMDGAEADLYAGRARDYPEVTQQAIIEMHRQVGDLVTDADGIALRGLMVRHLVMPNRVAGTREFVGWVAARLSKSTYVNIMAQYRVAHRAFEYPAIARAITAEEYLEAMRWAEEAGLSNLDKRSLSNLEVYRRRS